MRGIIAPAPRDSAGSARGKKYQESQKVFQFLSPLTLRGEL